MVLFDPWIHRALSQNHKQKASKLLFRANIDDQSLRMSDHKHNDCVIKTIETIIERKKGRNSPIAKEVQMAINENEKFIRPFEQIGLYRAIVVPIALLKEERRNLPYAAY